MVSEELKVRNEQMIARFNKWLADHPNMSPAEAKSAFQATLSDEDKDFLLEVFLMTHPEASKIMKS